ncbi:hypothetical protein MCHI_001383 [Candidatus Magnetoovum chiemensis]|nr:hypothetical protein MCHI_001383 [Candidatus Magnetoovum chiemensis]
MEVMLKRFVCKGCGHSDKTYADFIRYCPYCGSNNILLKCPDCRNNLYFEGQKYCSFCGLDLTKY